MPPASAITPAHSARRIIVIGGGLAGLVAARDIAGAHPDAEVLVLEGNDRVGGKLRLESVAGHLVDVGAEAMLALRPEGVDLIRELGSGDDIVHPDTTAASIWSRGELHPVPRATLMGAPGSSDGLDGLLRPDEMERLDAEEPWPGGALSGDVSVGEYVGTRLGQAVVDRLVEPLLGGVYAGRADELSLEATLPAVWQAATDGQSLAEVARRFSPPPAAPGASARPLFAGLRGGVGRLPELLVAAMPSGVTLRTSAMVRGLVATDGEFRVLVGPTTDEEWLEADAVVVATPPTAACRLLAEVAPDASAALAEMPSASSAVVTMAFARSEMPDLEGSGFLVPSVDGHLIKGATFSGNKWGWTDELAEDVVFLRASLGRSGEESLLQREDADLVAQCVREMGEAVGATLPQPVDTHVMRWGGGLPQYTVGHVGRMGRVRESVAAVPGLEVCGAAYDGVGIPAVIASARGAAAAMQAHLNVGDGAGRE